MKRLPMFAAVMFLLSPLLAHAAQVSWTGKGDGIDWTDPMNWSNNLVPTSVDDVSIGKFTVIFHGDTAVANTLKCIGIFTLDGNMNITSTASFTNLTLKAGYIVDGTVTITGPLTMAGGGIISRTGAVTVSGTTTVQASGSLASGPGKNTTISGTLTIMGLQTQLSGGGSFINTGVINIQGDGNAGINSFGGTVTNQGTIAKTMGTGTSIVATSAFNNSGGTVSAGKGTLQVRGEWQRERNL